MMNSTNTTDTRKAITQQLCRGFFALFIGFISCTNAFADWPLGFGGDDDVDVWDIQTDPLGGVVVVGTFTGTARFEDQGFGPTQLLVSEGDTDIFVAKYAASGNLLWVTQAGGAGNDNPHKMAIDDDGTIVVVGSFLYTARFGKYTLPGCGNYENVFISRLDKDGEWLPPATIETCSGPAVAVDTESGGNGIYVAIDNDVSRAEFSRWNVVPAFNPGTEIISYDSVNSWTAKVGTLGPHANEITGIAAADDGKIYVASFKKQGADETFCGTKIVVGSQYISMWEESSPPPVPGQPLSHSITCKWLVAVDDRNVIRQHDRGKEGKRDIPALVTDGSSAYFHYKGRFVKVDQNGIVYTDDFTSETFMVNGFGLAVDQLGNAVVSGTVNPENRTMVIGEGSASPLTLSALPAFTYDPFIAKRSASGVWEWAKYPEIAALPDALKRAMPKVRVAMDANGQVYVAGNYLGDIKFTNTPSELNPPTLTSANIPQDLSVYFYDTSLENEGYLDLDSSILNNRADFTLGFRAKIAPGGITNKSFASAIPYGTVLDAVNPDGKHEFSVHFRTNNILTVYSNAHGWEVSIPIPAFEDDQWHQYSLRREAGVTFKRYTLWVDGVSQGVHTYDCATDCSAFTVSPGRLILGQLRLSGGDTFQTRFNFVGELDEVRIWGSGEIHVDLESTLNGVGYPGLVAYWKFDNPYSGTALIDSSGNGFDLVLDSFNRNPGRPVRKMVSSFHYDGFMALMDGSNGEWKTPQKWVVGDAITPPGGTVEEIPEISIEGLTADQNQYYFFWSEADKALYSIGVPPGAVTISWKTSSDPTNLSRITTDGVNIYPSLDETQYHIAGAPVRLEPAFDPGNTDQPMRFSGVVSPSGAAGLVTVDGDNGPVFNQELLQNGSMPEEVVLRYYKTGSTDIEGNNSAHSPYFITVQTVAWDNENFNDDAAVKYQVDKDKAVPIGSDIVDGRHADLNGGNGYVLFELGPYDGTGANKAYDRDNRAGQIIPVNEKPLDQKFVVAWYPRNAARVAWPSVAVSYLPKWPANAAAITIANQQGTGKLLTSTYQNMRVYNQPNAAIAGYNPNEEHALLVVSGDVDSDGTPDPVVYAMRDDLNNILDHSKPYVLVKYQNSDDKWAFKLFKVCATQKEGLCASGQAGSGLFAPPVDASPSLYTQKAGSLLQAPKPFTNWPVCEESGIPPDPVSDPAQAGWEDYTGRLWARAANADIGNTILRYYYPLQAGFFFDFDEVPGPDAEVGTCIPWIDRGTGVPIDVAYRFNWPDSVPELSVGESLYTAKKNGLPELKGQPAAQIIFDQATYGDIGVGEYKPTTKSLVRLFDPTSERKVALAQLPDEEPTFRRNGREYFSDLPFTLRSRLSYDDLNEQLVFGGSIDEPITGDPQVLPNIMTSAERDKIKTLIKGFEFGQAVDALYHKTRNPNQIDLDGNDEADLSYLVGLMPTEDEATRSSDGLPDKVDRQALVKTPMILSAGKASGEGYVTLAVNNHIDAAGSPVDLYVMRVDGCTPYQGNIWVVPSDNVFEEALTLRHTGDFGGDPDALTFEWYFQPDLGQTNVPANDGGKPPAPWQPFPLGQGAGLVDITIEGPGVLTLSDNWFTTRANYSSLPDRICNGAAVPPATDLSDWAGAPGGTPANTVAMLATGWIKRVVGGLNPFDSRVSDFHENEASTLSSMIAQLGEPYAGPIPFNPEGAVINSIGMIEAYQTVFERGKKLSVDDGINNPAVNNQLLNVATRIADFYHLLGNEAFADAADPTIGFDTGSELGTLASSIFTFQNQLPSPLDEELALLRGRDDSQGSVSAHPVYNRLLWNFTQGDGEVAYVQSYGIADQNVDGFDGLINEEDAHFLYPQGHGDGWGHYLTSVKMRYDLLQEKNFVWVPRAESVLVAGSPIEVDYLDERKFAAAAAAKARTGAEIVNLTYRDSYVEDPNGQWQGYRDTDSDRAWGLDGWGRRAGQGALFDWVTANAILPAKDLDPTHTGIDRVDRTTVPELAQIASQLSAIQGQIDRADAGLNPIGLAKGVVPFDIDPNFDTAGTSVQGKTHFEQIADRAQQALDNAVVVFNHANQQSQALRSVQDDVDALSQSVVEQERDFKNRMIEIFGYPYPNDPDTPSGYDGPDLLKFMYVSTGLTEDLQEPDNNFDGFFHGISMGHNQYGLFFPEDFTDPTSPEAQLFPKSGVAPRAFNYPVSTGADWSFVAPSVWGERRAPGELQIAISDILQAQATLQLATRAHENLLFKVDDALDLVKAEYHNRLVTEDILVAQLNRSKDIDKAIQEARLVQVTAKNAARATTNFAEASGKAVPSIVGFSNDVGAPVKGSINLTAVAIATVSNGVEGVAEQAELGEDLLKDRVALATEINLKVQTNEVALIARVKELEQLWRQESVLQLEMVRQVEVVKQTLSRYAQILAEGDRLLEERRMFRITSAADTQEHRYRDMTFRIFRNDALQKYRAQFELAARYIYLAATAYDYETNLLGGDNGSGRDFLADIVRQRTLGQVINGVPVAGTPGLADVLARLTQNFEVYKGQLGFNNPQTETNRFSLRRELFRIRDDSDEAWRDTLESARVDNLWDVPEFRRFARAFTPESEGPQPGLVFRFPTTVTFGLNYFGHPLGGGDSSYSATNFATKIRSVGTWFSNYDGGGLSNTPRIYLFPVGMDVMRSPNDDTLSTREWRVVDQKLPVPFPIGASDLTAPDWIPANDSLSDTYADVRKFSTFRAYHDSGSFNEAETISDSRLIGRSVWNTEWMMIVPGGTLLYDGEEGLDQLISGQLIPGGLGERNGKGISDIKLFFQTYGYSGN